MSGSRELTDVSERTEVHLGPGALAELGPVLEARGARRVLVVHGRSSFPAGPLSETLSRSALELRFFGGVRPNPEVGRVAEAVAQVRAFAPDAVVGIGGGSVLDTAKVAALLGADGARDADVQTLLRRPERVGWSRRSTLVLVPTVSGSGSEMTRFATVYAGTDKLSLDHPEVQADVALIDPDLTASVPASTAASSALDAFCQGVESYWSVAATPSSRTLAMNAIEYVLPALLGAVTNGSFADPGVRRDLARGALLAGAAIDRTRTTAAHALSYGLTARFGIPHGYAVGLHLRWLAGHNAAVTDQNVRHPEGAATLRGLVEQVRSACEHGGAGGIEPLVDRVLAFGGMPAAPPAHEGWTQALASHRAANNPRLVTERDVIRAMTANTERKNFHG